MQKLQRRLINMPCYNDIDVCPMKCMRICLLKDLCSGLVLSGEVMTVETVYERSKYLVECFKSFVAYMGLND